MAESPSKKGLRRNDDMILRSTLFVVVTNENIDAAFYGLQIDPVQPIVHLPQCAAEAANLAGSPLLENRNLIDSIIMERLAIPGTDILQYASDCFFTIRTEKAKSWCNSRPIQDLLEALSATLINYTGLSLLTPELFCPDSAELGLNRIATYIANNGVKLEFLQALFGYLRVEDPDMIGQINTLCFATLSQQILGRASFSDGVEPLQGLNVFLKIEGAVEQFVENPQWIPTTDNGKQFQEQSVLGPFFSPGMTPRPECLMKPMGMDPIVHCKILERLLALTETVRSEQQYKAVIKSIEHGHTQFVQVLIDLVKKFLRYNREKMFAWFGASIQTNRSRVKLNRRTDLRALISGSSTDGFCMNVLDVLLHFCTPFFKLTDPKVDQIDFSYLVFSNRVDISDATPVNKEVDRQSIEQRPVNAISEWYCLCMLMFHYGWTEVKEIFIEISRKTQQLEDHFRRSRDPGVEKELKYWFGLRSGYHTILTDQSRNSNFLRLGLLNMHLLLKAANFDGQTLPLPTPINPIFAAIPEFWLQDTADMIEFVAKVSKEVINLIDAESANLLINFTTAFLISKEYFSTPFPRIAMVHMLSEIIETKSLSILAFEFTRNPLAKQYLIDGLIQFYVDIEFTDSHTQFYDKFNYRHFVTIILKFLWKQEHYQSKTLELQDTYHFVKFLNMLVNDTSFFIDEGIVQLGKIKEFRDKQVSGMQLNDEEVQTNTQIENYCKYLLNNANEAISMLSTIAPWTSQLFMRDEFRDRMAQMFNYFLVKLYGPGSIAQQIDNPQQLEFRPMELAADLLALYVEFSKYPEFIVSTVKDERSYDSQLLLKVAKDCNRYGKLPLNQLQAFEAFILRVKEAANEVMEQEADLGEVPDEYLCPITAEIMKNPVRLPTSGNICERSTISRILLSDGADPFNRQALTIEEVEECPELKAEIEAFIKEKTSNRGSKPADEPEPAVSSLA